MEDLRKRILSSLFRNRGVPRSSAIHHYCVNPHPSREVSTAPKFKWRTDNATLKWIKTMEPKGTILERWLTMLSEYDFEVEHRAGTKHGNMDALSRGGKAEEVDPEVEDTPAIQALCIILVPNLRMRLREAQVKHAAFTMT